MNIRFVSHRTLGRHAELISASYATDIQLHDE